MLSLNLEKQNDERLIFKRETPVKAALTSPFESTDDIILSGDFCSIKKGEAELRSSCESDIYQENEELRRAIKENRVKNALRDLKKIPNNPFLLNNLGLAYLGNKELEKAFEVFSRAVEINSNFIPISLNLASLYVAKKEYGSAMSIYKKLLQNNPNDTRVLINFGNIYFNEKKFKEAEDLYKKIIKIDPQNITSRNRLALLNLIDGRFTKAIAGLRKCLQINNELPAIYNNLGVAYGILGSFKKAAQSLKIALKISPYYTSAIHNLAVTLKQKDILSAIELLEDYLNRKENLRIRELLANFYLDNKQHLKALKTLIMILSIMRKITTPNREITRLHNNIGVVYHSLRNFEKAEENYFVCVKKMGYINPIIVGNIIDLYFDSARINNAKEYIEIYRNRFGERGFYFYYLARYLFYRGEISESINAVEKFLLTNKKFSPAYALLSYIYSEYFQNYKKAIELNETAFKNLPDDRVTINNLAYNYLMNNEIDKAESILSGKEEITNYVFLNATRGLLNIKKDNIEEGRRLYNLAAKIAEGRPLHKEVIQKKHLELARYYLLHNEKSKAKDNLEKVFSATKGKETVFTKHAAELYQQVL